MIKSMTGFASLTRDDELATITVTVKAVNHRFLDLQLRLPPSLAAAESRIRSLAQTRVARGSSQLRHRQVYLTLSEDLLDARECCTCRGGNVAPAGGSRLAHPIVERFGAWSA